MSGGNCRRPTHLPLHRSEIIEFSHRTIRSGITSLNDEEIDLLSWDDACAFEAHYRIISVLSQAVIIVEGGKNSDGLDSPAWAKRQGLFIYA